MLTCKQKSIGCLCIDFFLGFAVTCISRPQKSTYVHVYFLRENQNGGRSVLVFRCMILSCGVFAHGHYDRDPKCWGGLAAIWMCAREEFANNCFHLLFILDCKCACLNTYVLPYVCTYTPVLSVLGLTIFYC